MDIIYQSNHQTLRFLKNKPKNNVKIIFKWLIFDLSRGLLSTVLCIIIRASVVLDSSFTFIMTQIIVLYSFNFEA